MKLKKKGVTAMMKEAHEPIGKPSIVTEISRIKYRCEPTSEPRTDRETLCRAMAKVKLENSEMAQSSTFIKIGFSEETLQLEWFFKDNADYGRALDLLGK